VPEAQEEGSDDMIGEPTLFAELAPADIELIASHGVTRRYAKGSVLINEGDESDSLYVILDGKVKVYLSDENGKEVILRIQGAGEYFGELAIIDSAPRSASVITVETTRISVVTRAGFEQCMRENDDVALQLIRSLAARVRSLTENVRNLALLDVYGRIARTLLNLAEEHEGEQVILQRLTHQEIANMVGASREMVSRIMKDLTEGGYIEIRDRHIHIPRKLPAHY